MDIVTLGAALNGSAEYVNSHFKSGSNIQIVDNPDGTQTINASGEVSSEDTVARAEIAAIKDGETLDSFGDVETALDDKADTLTTYTKTDVDTALSAKANSADVYSKTAVDTALSNKADKSTTYTKTEVDTSLSNKADKSTTYTKTEVDTALGLKQDTISDLSTIRSGAALGATAVQPETGKGLSTNDYTTAEKTKLAGIAEGAEVNVQSNWTQTTTTADDYIKNKPTLGTAAAKNATDTYNATGTDVTTGKAVAAALATLPEPMVFKGSLGTGGTITTLPTASSSNKGYVYKVITAGTYASQSAKVGDTFISDGSAWVIIPSGDEPSGTVTNVAVANGGGLTVSGSPITSSGTITVGHSNSVTAKTSSSVKKFTYDAHGHVTGSSELSTSESDALASGIDSTKVAQIETNKNNISAVTMGTQSTGDIDLNAVTTNSYKMYTNTTSNLPTSDGSWYFVKTTVFDNNTMLQEATAMNAGAKTYTRIKRSGNWQAWKLSNLDSTQEAAVNSGINDTLVEQINTNKNNILFNANNGVKNLLKNTAVSTANNSVIFTVNDDKSIRVQGKPSSGIAEIVLSDLSELVDGQTYKLYGNQATNRTSFQIIGGSGIANIYATEAGTEFTFIRANYVRAVVRTQADAQTTDITIKPMITIPTMDGSTYQPNAKTNVELTNLTEEARTIYVGANEKFTKLTDAMKYAFEHKNTIVRVGAGTYNIISEMGNSYWANFTSYSDLTHAHIGNGSHFIFSPDSKVVCEYTGDNTNVTQLYSPFNSLDGNEGDFTLEGLTLVVSGCRYAIHDDIGASTVRQTHKYINCEITNDIRCIGAGLGADETVEMRDCIFHSTGAVGNSPVSWHNSGGGTTGKGSIVMTGCYVDGAGDNAVQFLAYGVSPKETNVIVSNNSFNAAPSCRKYDETIQYMNFKMLDFNNEIRT